MHPTVITFFKNSIEGFRRMNDNRRDTAVFNPRVVSFNSISSRTQSEQSKAEVLKQFRLNPENYRPPPSFANLQVISQENQNPIQSERRLVQNQNLDHIPSTNLVSYPDTNPEPKVYSAINTKVHADFSPTSNYFNYNQQTYFTDSYHQSPQNCISRFCCPRLSIKNTTNNYCCCNCDDNPIPDYRIGFEPWCGGVCKDWCWGFFS